MKLTKTERLLLANQLLILEELTDDPAEVKHYEQQRTAIQDGYELNYSDAFQNIDDGTLSEDGCREVLDILDMYRVITFVVRKVSQSNPIQHHHYLKFSGFDGNHETELMAYTGYNIIDLNRYHELRSKDEDFNSHSPRLDIYRRMLTEWRKSADKDKLTEGDVKRILDAT
jgi:uncharacterized protein YfbU (UPF0304 family)